MNIPVTKNNTTEDKPIVSQIVEYYTRASLERKDFAKEILILSDAIKTTKIETTRDKQIDSRIVKYSTRGTFERKDILKEILIISDAIKESENNPVV